MAIYHLFKLSHKKTCDNVQWSSKCQVKHTRKIISLLSYAIERLPEMSSGHLAVKIVDSVCLPRPRGYMFIYATCSVMALVEKATIQVIFTLHLYKPMSQTSTLYEMSLPPKKNQNP